MVGLPNILENQKDITELYQELSYEDLTEVLNQWLNPEATEEKKVEKAPAAAVVAASTATVEDASAAFDELFNK